MLTYLTLMINRIEIYFHERKKLIKGSSLINNSNEINENKFIL
jgi:hypothetical protein